MTEPTDHADARSQTGTTTSEPSARRADRDVEVWALTLIDHPEHALVGACEPLMPGQRAVIGRGARELFPGVFEQSKVSRRHTTIEVGARGEVKLGDLGSHNGTFVNERRIQSQVLADGDVVRVGDALMLFHARPAGAPRARHKGIVGVGTGLGRVLREVDQVARHPTTVVLMGETGVGKEVIAHELHAASGRAGPLVALNCGGVGETLVASELFGHVRGAFTGADRRRSGLIETAKGGTLFLDEVMDAAPGLQASLLRLFETGEYRAVGSDHTERADVRFVVAAQPEIEARIADKSFRLDLWARIARWIIRIPALRERREDIAVLARHFAARYAGRTLRLAPDLIVALIRHDWPGNVRELQGVVERLVIAQSQADELGLDPAVFEQLARREVRGAERDDDEPGATSRARRPHDRPDKAGLEAAIAEHGGNVRATALALGIGRKTLYRWMEAYGIDVALLRDRLDDA